MQIKFPKRRFLHNTIHLFCAGFLVAFVLLLTGCGSSSSPAVNRDPGPGAVKADAVSTTKNDYSNSVINTKLFSQDHFAFIGFNVAEILNDPKTKDIEIAQFVEQMATISDKPLVDIKNVKHVYVLMDNSLIEDLFASATSEDRKAVAGVVIVFEQSQPFDVEAIEKQLNAEPTLSPFSKGSGQQKIWANLTSKNAVTLLDQHHLLIGAVKGIESITQNKTTSPLAIDASKTKFDSHVIGMMRFEPIRPTIRALVNAAKSFAALAPKNGGAAEARKILDLPQVTETAKFKLNLSGSEMLQVTAVMENVEHANELSSQFAKSLAMMSNISSTGSNVDVETMIPPTGGGTFTELLKDLSQGGAKIETKGATIEIRVKQSQNTEAFVRSFISYANRMAQLNRRVEAMTRIGKAFKDYVRDNEAFPVIAGQPESGQPFNWRVALLPYLGHKELYEKFKFDEAWDSQHNLSVAKEIPSEYKLFVTDQKITLRVGTGIGPFRKPADGQAEKVTFESIKDDLDETILVVETSKDHAIEWTKPGALSIDKESLPKFGRDNENGFLALMFEGQVRMVKKSSQSIAEMFTPDGDERIKKGNFFRQ